MNTLIHRIPGTRAPCTTPLELDPARRRATCEVCGAEWDIELIEAVETK